MNEPPTPECDRWADVHTSTLTIRDFIEFLRQRGITLGQYFPVLRYSVKYSTAEARVDPLTGDAIEVETGEQEYQPTNRSLDSLIYEFFQIDESKLEEERRALLDHLRNQS